MMPKCKGQEASLVTVAADDTELSERTIECRRKASRGAESGIDMSGHPIIARSARDPPIVPRSGQCRPVIRTIGG